MYFLHVFYIVENDTVIILCRNSSMKPPLKRAKLHSNIGNNWSFYGAIIIRSSETHDNWYQDNQLFHFTVFSAFVFEM